MIVFPNCKINLGLKITRKRNDGYHDIETVFYPVKVTDSLEVISMEPGVGDLDPVIHNYGLKVEGNPEDNLCMKAWHLLKKDFPSLPAIQIHLLKHIPMGAGLGGGSANGAFMLKLLNEKFGLRLSTGQLMDYALQLGSDCPFFILNRPCHATGRGEKLEPVNMDLSGYRMILVMPGIHVNTGWAFSQLNLQYREGGPPLKGDPPPSNEYGGSLFGSGSPNDISSWKESLFNDFEGPVFAAHPSLRTIKDELYNAGAVYAAMSGSGSTIFGLFEKHKALPHRLPAPLLIVDL